MPFIRTSKVWIKIFATALLFAVLFSGEAQAADDITSFEGLEACVADTSKTECAIGDDFYFTGKITISRDLTIKGDATLYRADDYTGALFSITDSANVTIRDLVVNGGASGWEKDLTPENIQFRYNAGGDRVYGGYNLTLDDNDTLASEPLIDNLGTLTISGATFLNSYNQSSTPSVISNRGSITIDDTIFLHNVARANSTIMNYDNAALSVSGSTFIDNNAGIGTTGYNGGAINSSYGPLSVTDCQFHNNAAVNDGGAISTLSGELTISNSSFTNNASGNDGSAIRIGRGVSGTTTPLENEATGVLSDLTFSENINLSTYWVNGEPSPNGTAAHSNGQGVIAYFNDGYEDLTIKDSSFSGDVTSWGVISLYSCDNGVDPSLCSGPNYLIDGIEMHNETGSLISASSQGNLTIKNSTLEPGDAYAIAAYNMQDVSIESTTIIGGSVSLNIHDNETACLDNVTIEKADLAFSVYNIDEVEIDELTIRDSHHESRPNYYVGVLTGVDTAALSNVNYYNNAGKMRFSNTRDLTISDSFFCSSKNQALEIGGASGETNATITNTSVCRDISDGPAMTVLNYGDNDSVSRDVRLTLGNGFTIVDNENNRDTDDPDNLSSGYGGGIYVEAYDDVYLTVSEDANISGNSASNAGNDIFVRSMNDDTTVYVSIYGDYVEDSEDNRATTASEPAQQQYTVRGGEALGLSHAIAPDEASDTDDVTNPETSDSILFRAAFFALASLCGAVIVRSAHRR